jgi:Na+/melibiose symporter-like transporter
MVVSLIDSAGNGAFVSAGVVLFSIVLHLSPVQIGQGFAVGAVVGLALSVYWGSLADRLGVRTILVTVLLWRAVGSAALVFADSFAIYVAVVVFLSIGERASPPILLSFVTRAVDETDRVKTAGALRSIRNAGFTLGALASSLALISPGRTSLAVVVLGNAASFVLAAFLLGRMPLRKSAAPPTKKSGQRIGLSVLRRPAFLVAAGISGVLSIHRQILSVGLPLWIVTRDLAPTALVSVLVAINTIIVVVLQVRMTKKTDDPAGAGQAQRRAGWALLAFTLFLAASVYNLPAKASSVVVLLVVAVVIFTFAEMWQSAGAWGVSLALAPEAARSRFLSVFNLGESALDVTGALLLTSLVLPAGPTGWLVLGGVLAFVGMLAPRVALWADRERQLADVEIVAEPTSAGQSGDGLSGAVGRHRAGGRHRT